MIIVSRFDHHLDWYMKEWERLPKYQTPGYSEHYVSIWHHGLGGGPPPPVLDLLAEVCRLTGQEWKLETANPARQQAPFEGLRIHQDVGRGRRQTATLYLSDDYDGGEFIIHERGSHSPKMTIHHPSRGMLITYPAETWHSVTPVTRGSRDRLNLFLL